MDISFVIPAKNEELEIESTIQSIFSFVPKCFVFEVIVVDNGSDDDTVNVATKKGATVLHNPTVTIAELRNLGVQYASANVLVFLDADVKLTEKWSSEILTVVSSLKNDPMLVTGSRCGVANPKNFISKFWFSLMIGKEGSYINSGHLITSRVLFDKIGGFDSSLVTAEDYDFCQKAKGCGAEIKNNPNLVVIHTGYPETIVSFIKRERWHGAEDFKSFGKFFSSKQALLAFFHAALFVASFFCTFFFQTFSPVIFYFTIMVVISVLFAYLKFYPIKMYKLFGASVICYAYIWGRTLSLCDRLIK